MSIKPFAWLGAQLLYPTYKSRKTLCEAVDQYLSAEERNNRRIVKRVKKGAFYCKRVYKTTYEEFFIYGFDRLNDRGKKTYIGDYERQEIMERAVSDYTFRVFANKYETYRAFRPFFRRDAVPVNGIKDLEGFLEFAGNHRDLIVKPLCESLGKGVYLVNLDSLGSSARELFDQINANGPAIIEERIQQSAKMASLHPNSVNTVRILTKLNADGTAEVIDSFLKIGRDGKCVDNGGQGGLLAGIDLESGIVTSPGISEKLEEFICHPNTGCQIIGFSIPQWEEVKALSMELACVVPEQRVVGWDLAHTEDGWVLVEGNSKSMFIGWQITGRKGWRSVAEKHLSEWMS